MAQITGHKAGKAYHKIVNAHIFNELKREPYAAPKLHINPDIKTLEDIKTWVTLDDFEVVGYEHHDAISYKFSV